VPRNFLSDLRLIGATFLACLASSPAPPIVRHALRDFSLTAATAQQVSAAKSFETAI